MIRSATPDDTAALVELIHELAEYEREPHQVEIDPSMLADAMFGEHPAVFAHVAEVDGEVVGMALFFRSFSTWTGRHGIYLEDLFVRPAHRGRGLGRALVASLADLAVERGYPRLEWAVLDWNEPAIGFYRSLGAAPMDEWTVFRLSGVDLAAVARRPPSGDVAPPPMEPPVRGRGGLG